MKEMQINQRMPAYIPRIHLSEATLVGMEIRVKRDQHILPAYDTFRLIQSGNCGDLLQQINVHLSQWRQKTDKPLYLSWELSDEVRPSELELFLHELSSHLPTNQLEIVFNAQNLTASESIKRTKELFKGFPEKCIRRGIFHNRPLDFKIDEICENFDLFKLKDGVIKEMQADLDIASKSRFFIEKLNGEKIDIVADDLYSRSDVTRSILMGIQYGQGFFLSRNQKFQDPVMTKTLKRKPDSDVYERSFDRLHDLIMWT